MELKIICPVTSVEAFAELPHIARMREEFTDTKLLFFVCKFLYRSACGAPFEVRH